MSQRGGNSESDWRWEADGENEGDTAHYVPFVAFSRHHLRDYLTWRDQCSLCDQYHEYVLDEVRKEHER